MKKIILAVLVLFIIPFVKAQNEGKTNSSTTSLAALPLSVTIGGDFLTTGTFPAYLNERVDGFITRMYNEARLRVIGTINDPQMLERINKKLEEYSIRDIVLKRSSGETLHLDLLKFRLTGDFKYNPYLKNDDVIIFKNANMETDFFTISGAVNKPSKFAFVDGDKLSDAVQLAQGISKAYENVTKATIYRLSYNGEKQDQIIVDLNSDYALQRGDRVVVLADETQRKEFNAMVLGEVKQPGTIPITKNSTTLSEAIEEAGGFTDQADLSRAKFLSGKNLNFILDKEFGLNTQDKSLYFKDLTTSLLFDYEKAKMLRTTTLTENDTAFFSIDEIVRQMLDESSFNLDSVLDKNSAVANVRVHNGDVIVVPHKLITVYVYGQVANPGNVSYAEGKDYRYYIKAAGGLSSLAKEDEIVVIKGVSREWIPVKDASVKIEPGDYVYIPKDPNHTFDYYISRVSTYLSILGSTATIILLLIKL